MLRPIASRSPTLVGMIALLLLVGCGDDRVALAPPAAASLWPEADVERGRQLIQDYGCVACHAVPGVRGPSARVGPPLKNIALRSYVGGVLPNTPDNLLRWLQNPPAVDPRTAMPNMGITAADAKDIAAYLLTLN